MQALTVLLAEQDSAIASHLATSLDEHRHSVRVVHSLPELRSEIARLHAQVVVVDLETVGLADVSSLRREFQVPIICTHRIPDDELWTAAMEAGAADICERSNVPALVRALRFARSDISTAA
jgi:DNA-binding response OmpR family regulator